MLVVGALLAAALASTAGLAVPGSGAPAGDAPVSGPPGAMLESGPMEAAVPNAGSARRILYASRDGLDDAPVAVSGMLFLPAGDPPAGGWPLLSWAHGTVGVADACAPSRRGPGAAAANYFGRWLGAGFAVVATDYQGLGTPGPHLYLAKVAEGRAVLDAARAALAVDGIGGPVVIAGQSQGGGAALAAGGLAADYAPELNVTGIVATGPPYLTADMPTASGVDARRVDPGLAYVLYAARTATTLDPGLDPATLFTEEALPVFEAAAESCVGELMDAIRDAGLTQADALRPGAVAALMPRLLPHYAYPTLDVGVPVFVGTGSDDRDVDPRGQRRLVHDLCAAGTRVSARIYAGEDHTGAWRASWDDQLALAGKLLENRAIPSDCPDG